MTALPRDDQVTSLDDAGGGRRGLRARPSADLFQALREAYGIEADAADSRHLGGSSSLNLLVGSRWVVRAYRPYVRPERIEAINAVRTSLTNGGVPCAELRLTRDGQAWARLGDRLIEVDQFVASDSKMHDWERVQAALPTLGRIHTLLSGLSLGEAANDPEFANYVGPDEAVAWAAKARDRIRSWKPTDAEARLGDRALELAEKLAKAEFSAGSDRLPRQLVHGDFWDNNVLFRDGRLVLVTDFDFMGARTRVDDLALTLCCAGLDLARGRAPTDLFDRLPSLVAAYERGLDQPLTDRERIALPLAVARQPLCAARWLTVLDSEATARGLASAVGHELNWAGVLLGDLGRWQGALARRV